MAEGEENYFNKNNAEGNSADSEYSLAPKIESDIHEASLFSQKELTKAEQEKAAAELEQKRQLKETPEIESSETTNLRTPRTQQLQQQIQTISTKINGIRKESSEKNTKMARILKKKRSKEQEAEAKIIIKIIRIVIEALTGIGIPLAIWEIIKLAKNSKDIQTLRKDQKKIKNNIIQNEVESKKSENQMQVDINNLMNLLNSEAANQPNNGEKAA